MSFISEQLLTLNYTVITGYRGQVCVTKQHALEIIEKFNRKEPIVIITDEGNLVGLNPMQLVDFRIDGLCLDPEAAVEIEKPVASFYKIICKLRSQVHGFVIIFNDKGDLQRL
ncbi:hypothetical protein [Paenibacillus chitinolyticus]